jgi:hypothetical protein
MRAALLAGAWPGASAPMERIELVVFFDHQDFQGYFGDRVLNTVVLGAYPSTVYLYGRPDTWEKFSMVTSYDQTAFATGEKYTTSALKQALAQHLATFFYRRQPKWFAIGLSEFLETLQLSDDGKTATFGFVNQVSRYNFTTIRSVSVSDAFAWGSSYNPDDEGSINGVSGLSWMMVYWMYNAHLAEFARFQGLLRTGLDPDHAWKVVFPSLGNSELERELTHFAQYGRTGLWTVNLPAYTATVKSVRPMSAAEVHALRAGAELAAEHAKRAVREQSEALADDPANVTVLREQMRLAPPAEQLVMARRATAAHPDDGLAWLMLGDALGAGGATWTNECRRTGGRPSSRRTIRPPSRRWHPSR